MFVILKKLTFFSLIAFVLININYTYAAYITKKSDTSKAVERIEKEFANGNITKAECVKKKSKVLKLKKKLLVQSKTIFWTVKSSIENNYKLRLNKMSNNITF